MLEYFKTLSLLGWVEIASFFFGFFQVVLEVNKSRYLWHFCILSAICSFFVFLGYDFPALMALQLFYIGNAIYGLVQFRKRGCEDSGKVVVSRFNWKKGGISAGFAVLLFFVLTYFLKERALLEGCSFESKPYWDALLAAGSVLGTYYLSESYFCQWYIWLIINIISVVIFLVDGMFWMAALFFIYLVITIKGILYWKKNAVYLE